MHQIENGPEAGTFRSGLKMPLLWQHPKPEQLHCHQQSPACVKLRTRSSPEPLKNESPAESLYFPKILLHQIEAKARKWTVLAKYKVTGP